ncbi:MAG: acetyl ornithine aminotransferase family protein [Anaerolineae bacterium]|nr:acetyl ornithine aminotransferase family protein [Anaerolineae bacterium]
MTTQMDEPGPKCKAWIERDRQNLTPSTTRPYPFVMDHGRGAEVWDLDGKRFLDFCAGIAVCATGHSHPQVVQAIQDQAARFIHMSGTDFYYPLQIQLAEKLNALAPIEEETRVFYANSGTESVEAAFKMARYHSGRPRALAFIGAFHGRTMGSLSLTASKVVQRNRFAPLVPGVTHVPYAYCYRCPFHLDYPRCDVYCVQYIEDVVLATVCPPQEVAALFVEPIQGEGGYIVPPAAYYGRIRDLCQKHGILFVVDEVQTGLGRTGKMFAIEHWGVEPDIIALAKGIASGMPLGATIARKSVMDWEPGSHANTFGGNPVSCAASLATIDLLENGLVDNAARMGEHVLDALSAIQARHPSIGDVRGKGLMIAVELVEDKTTKEYATGLRNDLMQECYWRGLLTLGCGKSSLRFSPPLLITREQADEAMEVFESALTACEQRAYGP